MSRGGDVYVWSAAGIAAIAYLAVMFIAGTPPTHNNRVTSEVAGLLTIEPARIVRIEVFNGEHRHTFERQPTGWSPADGHADESVDELLETALGLIHRSAPIRALQPEQTAGVAPGTYGFVPPSLEIRLTTNMPGLGFDAAFGDPVNDGRARYVRLPERPEIWIVSGFIYDAWRALLH